MIINKKGMLFNKINLLDLIIIIFIILVITFISINTVFRGNFFKKISDLPELEYVQIDVVLLENYSWIKKYINVGDVQGSLYGKPVARILEIKEVDGFGENKRLLVKIMAFASKDKLGMLFFGKHVLRIGEEILFYTPKYIFKGYIVNYVMTGEKVILKD